MRYNGKAFAQRGIAQLVEQRSPKPRAEGSNPSAPAKALTERSEPFCFRPPSCLPCVRGGAERMRSGGVVGTVQEKVAWYRKPVPTRYPQPLSQTLRVCQLPLHRGAKPCGGRRFPSEGAGCEFSPSVACGDSSLVRGSQGAGIESFAQHPLRKRTEGWRPLRPPQGLPPLCKGRC